MTQPRTLSRRRAVTLQKYSQWHTSQFSIVVKDPYVLYLESNANCFSWPASYSQSLWIKRPFQHVYRTNCVCYKHRASNERQDILLALLRELERNKNGWSDYSHTSSSTIKPSKSSPSSSKCPFHFWTLSVTSKRSKCIIASSMMWVSSKHWLCLLTF